MYFLIKHVIDSNLSQVIYYNANCQNVRCYLNNYLEQFLKDNNNLETEYNYEYSDDSNGCTILQKKMNIYKGYIWNSVDYEIKPHSYYSISYFSRHYITNVNIQNYKVFNNKDKYIDSYNNLIRDLKKNPKFLSLKKMF